MSISVFDMLSLQHLWSSEEMRNIFSEEGRIQKWLDFEASLARIQATLNIIPSQAAEAITLNANITHIDIAKMAAEIRCTKHSLVPFLRQFEAMLGEHGKWLHYGITTQDVIDTGMILQLKDAHKIYLRDISFIGNELVQLARTHRDTIMVGRTHGVHALPITFGHKCAIWLDEISRHYTRLRQCEPRLFVGMLVGAVGTQAALGPKAREIEIKTLQSLGLNAPDISWAPARDRVAEYANVLSMLGATLSKISNEVFNLQRSEFGEIAENFTIGKMGSSTMPHKRNPAAAENITGLSRAMRYNAAMMTEAMLQEHERDGIAWKTEWKALPECCLIMGAMLEQTLNLLRNLEINKAAMTRNLDTMQGYLLSERVMFELGEKVGKNNAYQWVYEATMYGISNKISFANAIQLHEKLANILQEDELLHLTNPTTYLGETGASIDRVIAAQIKAGWTTNH